MTKNLAVAAPTARPALPSLHGTAAMTKAESNLERIAGGESPARVYYGEGRPWWDLASADTVLKAVSDELFQACVRLAEALA